MKTAWVNKLPHGRHLVVICALSVAAFVVMPILSGCDDNNRVPTKAEVQAADVNRQSYIDKLNIPESQKAAMRAHLGGNSVPSPAAAAQQNAPGAKDRR